MDANERGVGPTSGPWWTDGEYSEDEKGVAIIAANPDFGPMPGNPTRGMVAWASELLPRHAGRCAANARLIAAAPDLLEALEQQADGCSMIAGLLSSLNGPAGKAVQGILALQEAAARAAIAKARGERA
jgi:hypothetical protein